MKTSMFFRPGCTVLAAIFFCNLPGCGKKNAVIHGTVAYDGQIVDNGTIAFIPDGEPNSDVVIKGTVGVSVIEGKYSLIPERALRPGKYRVAITWDKNTGEKMDPSRPNSPDKTEQILPEKYNTQSELTVDITSSSDNVNFNLSP